jgi:hypothetical protein
MWPPTSKRLRVLLGALTVCIGWALWASGGNPLLVGFVLVLCATGGGIVAYRSKRWLFSSAVTILFIGAFVSAYYVIVPTVIFKIDVRAIPGHMLIEFRNGCPDSTRRFFPRRIEYVVPATGYTCSSTPLPDAWMRTFIAFYDATSDPATNPPPLVDKTFFATGRLECSGSPRQYVHKDLILPSARKRETWYDFTERVGFHCS